MKAYLEQQRNWLTVEGLPGYAPDLNPVEMLWDQDGGLAFRRPSAPDRRSLPEATLIFEEDPVG
jgi:hypothetical protein